MPDIDGIVKPAGGSLTPWTTDINTNGHMLNDSSNVLSIDPTNHLLYDVYGSRVVIDFGRIGGFQGSETMSFDGSDTMYLAGGINCYGGIVTNGYGVDLADSATYASSAGGGWPTSLSGFYNDAGYINSESAFYSWFNSGTPNLSGINDSSGYGAFYVNAR